MIDAPAHIEKPALFGLEQKPAVAMIAVKRCHQFSTFSRNGRYSLQTLLS